jgi:uncharacterized oxidoreductase
MQIAGKTVLVTGGTDGIGLEIARQMKAKDATVIVCGRQQERLNQAEREGLAAIQADLSSAAGCAKLIADLGAAPIDILINNAGMGANFGPEDPLDLVLTDRAIFLNLNAPMHLIGLMLDSLRTRSEAAIINVTSGLAIAPRAGGPVYCATKAGLRSFTQALRHNLKGTNIHIMDALPPVVDTALTAGRGSNKMSPKECARQIIAGIETNKRDINVGMVKLLQLVHSFSPKLARMVMIRF